jgi:hypothetical protein
MRTFALILIPGAWLLPTMCVELRAQDADRRRTEANVMVELSLPASRDYANSFVETAFDVAFTEPSGRELRVPAFWASDRRWKVRYASPVVGRHKFRSLFPDTNDRGLHDFAGEIEVTAYRGTNPLYRHGALQVAANRRYLEHQDHTPFLWLGDTWWMGLCHRLHWPDEFQALAADRRQKGFNVVQIVAGLYPDMPPFDPRGANENGFPWEPNYTRIRPEYFDAADRRIAHLVDAELIPCIVGAWGYFIPLMGVERMKQHWRNLIARYGAWPVVWCIAGEANLPYYLVKGFPYDDREQVKQWTEVARYVRKIDPYHRPITMHPTGLNRLSARHAIDDVALLDIDMLQTPHGERAAMLPTVRTVRESYADHPIMPVINGEASYEMLNGKIEARWPRAMFWICMLNGAAGHTYGANGIWQCNRREAPHGASPHGGNYGNIPWDDAMQLPGSTQVGLGKALLAKFRWQNFEPHPEWARFAPVAPVSFDGAEWIWFPAGEPARDAPVAKRYFRKRVSLPTEAPVRSARLRVSADDRCKIFINGTLLGMAADWKAGRQFDDLARVIRRGENLIAIEAENVRAPVPANPAGLLVVFEIETDDAPARAMMRTISDATWRSAENAGGGWEQAGFDDTLWRNASRLGAYGMAPWGKLADAADELIGPQAAGVRDSVRIIYVPEPRTILVRDLDAPERWIANYFDPITGSMMPAPVRHSGTTDAEWRCAAPEANDRDWVLLMRKE